MLECVVNISEGRRAAVISAVAVAGGRHLLDVHTDPDHHRSVLTLAGPGPALEVAAFAVVAAAVGLIDLRDHAGGAHPRLGAADVVPIVALAGSSPADAVDARDRLARRIATDLGVPCFRYGDDRPLPEVRRRAFVDLVPDDGPPAPHPSAGACCVGARGLLVAYNLWLASPATVADARRIAGQVRRPGVRALGLQVGVAVQVSCNLTDPLVTGPGAAFDAVAASAPVERAELVGLVPEAVLAAEPEQRWAQLDLSPGRTIEARLEQAGLDGGRFVADGPA